MTRAICDTPQVLFEELIDAIKQDALSAPRDLQRRIGPSGIGTECPIWLAHMIAQTPEPPSHTVKWAAWVGTAIHTRLESIFGSNPRYLVEQRVTVGMIGDQVIDGSMDLFDLPPGLVGDWKTFGKSAGAKYKANIKKYGHPGQQKRIQAHTYGLGAMMAGHKVNQVMNVFLPRDGKLEDAFYWAEDFNPQIALDQLAHCNEIAARINEPSVGVYGYIAELKDANPTFECPDFFCPWCIRKRREPTGLPSVTADDPFGLGTTKGNT